MNIFRGPVELTDADFPCFILLFRSRVQVSVDQSIYSILSYYHKEPPRRFKDYPEPTTHSVKAYNLDQAFGIVESIYRRSFQ